MIDIEKIKRAAEAATPGPWDADAPQDATANCIFSWTISKSGYGCVGYWRGHKHGHNDCFWVLSEQDANHIASANPAAVLELIARLEAAERDNAMLRRLLAVSASGSDLYTDDGELTDASETMLIDYKRDAVEEIEQKLRDRALDALAEINVSLGLTD